MSELKEFPHNPRRISEKQFFNLKDSFQKYNYVELIAIDKDNTIIAGHMRAKALLSEDRGDEEIEVRVPNRKLSKDEREGYLIASNHITGEDDFDLLANYFDPELLLSNGMSEETLNFTPLEKLMEEEEQSSSDTKCPACGQKIKKNNKVITKGKSNG